MPTVSDNLLRVLIAHHSSHEAESLLNVLRKAGYATRPTYVSSAADLGDTLDKGKWDLVLSADHLDDAHLAQLMASYTATQKDMPVIVVAESDDEGLVVDAMLMGARDCIPSHRPRHLLEAVRRELGGLEQRRDRRLCESTLREYKRRNNALLAAAREAVAFVADGMHIHANDHYAQVFGLADPAELAQLPVMDLVAGDHRPRFREFLRHHGGEENTLELTALRDGEPFAALFRLTESVYEGEACLQLVVTSLEPNVAAPAGEPAPPTDPVERLLAQLEERVVAAIKGQRRSCLLYAQLDDFDALRGELGVAASHQLVGDIAGRLRDHLDQAAFVTRCGDSAIALLIDDPELQASASLGERIRALVAAPDLQPRGHGRPLTCSLGLVSITELTPGGQEAFNWAVDACQRAATAGGDRAVSHEWSESRSLEDGSPDLVAGVEALLTRTRDALRFRPIVGLHGHRREFYEVIPLVGDDHGTPYPTDQVYRAAEAGGLAAGFDQWMLERVIELIEAQVAAGRDACFILGFSDEALSDENRVLSVAKSLKNAGLEGERLIFRLSEAAASTNARSARSFVTGLHKLGCRVALTHFGSSINPFRILEHVDADYLAFDAAFVQDITRNPESRQAVEQLCGEAKRLAKLTLAPGVRDADTLAVLWQCGVDYASGDYLQEASPDMSYDFMAEA